MSSENIINPVCRMCIRRTRNNTCRITKININTDFPEDMSSCKFFKKRMYYDSKARELIVGMNVEDDPVFDIIAPLCAECTNNVEDNKKVKLCGKHKKKVKCAESYDCDYFKANMEHSHLQIAEQQILEKRGFI